MKWLKFSVNLTTIDFNPRKPSLLISHLVLPGSCERRRHSLPSSGRTDFSEDSSFLAGDEEARVAATLPSSPGPLVASCFSVAFSLLLLPCFWCGQVLQVVAIAVFLALGFAFYIFFVPFVGGDRLQYLLMGLYTPLVNSCHHCVVPLLFQTALLCVWPFFRVVT